MSRLIGLALTTLINSPGLQPAVGQVSQDRMVPAITMNLAKYIEWPVLTRAKADRPYFYIGVLNSKGWLDSFQELEGKTLHGLKVKVIGLSSTMDPDDLRRCHIIFAPHAGSLDRLKPVALRGSTLIISDDRGTASSGRAGIELVPLQSKMAFEIGLDYLRASNLQIRASVLRLAAEVHKSGSN